MAEPDEIPDRDPADSEGSRSFVAGPDEQASDRPNGKRRRQRRQLPLWQELIVLLVIALGMAVILKTLFVQLFYIPSASMSDTLVRDDRISVEKVSYWFDEPERGDIVVFADPGGWLPMAGTDASALADVLEFFGLYPAGDHLVKRVIGVGGDRVRCCDKQGRIVVNGQPLNESSYLAPSVRPSQQKFNVTVPEGRLWVMGDNRPNSADSRAHLRDGGSPAGAQKRRVNAVRATIPVDSVVGRVFATVWPPGRTSMTDRPETFESVADRDAS